MSKFLFMQDVDDFVVGEFGQPESAEHSVVVSGMKIMPELADATSAGTSYELPTKRKFMWLIFYWN